MTDSQPLGVPATLRFHQLAGTTKAWFWTVLCLTLAACLFWSHFRLFWIDELLEYYTDSKPSAAAIIAGQLHAPFSLEPPAFHLLLHWLPRIIPSIRLAARLPSMLALLVTEACVFFIALRRYSSQSLAATAMVLPFFLVTVDYGPEARIYSVLTACLAVALLCWQAASSRSARRGVLLAGLAASLILANLVHYYGVLLVLPLWVGELVRTFQRRRLDRAVIAALLVGTGSILLDLPFQRALAPLRLHYYNSGETQWHIVTFTYSWFLEHFRAYVTPPRLQAIIMRGVMLLVAGIVAHVTLTMYRRWRSSAAWVDAALLIAFLLPVVNALLTKFTHAYYPRYSLPAIVGVSVLMPATAYRYAALRKARFAVAALLLLVSLVYCYRLSRVSQREGEELLAAFQPSAALWSELQAQPDHTLYVQDLARFLSVHYYTPPALNSHITGFYAASCELRWLHRDPSSIYAHNMGQTANMPLVPFAQVRGSAAPKLLVLYHEPAEEWIEQELQFEGAMVTPLGRAIDGDLVRVTFPASPSCDNSDL